MHSRRDQVEAHSFVKSRLRSALLRGEPDAAQPPLRRTPIALVLGAVLGVLAIAIVAVFALLKPPSGKAWRKPGALIVEKQTGNRYVLSEGRLRPVLNYASARLLLGDRLTVTSTSAKTLARLPRGGQIGIIGAPDTLPPATAADQPWLVCATSPQDSDGISRPGVTVLLGAAAQTQSDRQSESALVRTPDGAVYLAAAGKRMRLTAPWVSRALGLDERRALRVRSNWAGALPAGPDLGTLPVNDRGRTGPTLDGRPTRVGQVLLATGSPGTGDRHYLITPDGLTPIGETAVALTLGDPATAAAYGKTGARELPISPTALASAPITEAPQWTTELPPIPAALVTDHADRVPCVLTSTADHTATSTVVSLPAAAVTTAHPVDAPGLERDRLTADSVGITPGGGMLARTLPAPGIPGAGLYLVVDSGAKYPVDGDDAAKALGYSPDDAATVPADLLAMLPTGPVLHALNGRGA